MSKYNIRVKYTTGDSFNNYDMDETLEMGWDDIEVAKLNLKRIQEHYLWYADKNGYRTKKTVKRPKWHEDIEHEFTIRLVADNGNDMQFTAMWCGYFETLHEAEIVTNTEDLKITFD